MNREDSEKLIREEIQDVKIALQTFWNNAVDNRLVDDDVKIDVNLMYEKLTQMLMKFNERLRYEDMFKN